MTQNFLKIAPFQIYSSSVDTGYNAEISASFKPGIDITNMKTDRYSDLNDAPMQGVFAEKYVGGSQFRHIGLNDGNDDPNSRPELYNIVMTSSLLKVVGPDSIDVNRPRASYFRDGFSKRPVNLANIHSTGSDVGNYEHDYQILQTVSRTTNNRAFTEATGSGFAQYLTTQYVTGAKDPNRALPNFDLNGKNEFVFVSRFNAPGGTDVSSRGVLDTYAEEYAPSNDINTRNHTVRSQLRSDLARHTPKAGAGIPTSYHNDNRNTKYYKRKSPQDTIEDLVTIAGSSALGGIALDTAGRKMYWVDTTTDKIQRANLDGSNVEDLVTIAGTSILYSIALDTAGGKMYWTDASTKKIQRANLDGSSIEDLYTIAPPPFFNSNLIGIAVDPEAGKVYWTDSTNDKIQRANSDGSSGSPEDLVTIAVTSQMWGISLDLVRGKMYWTDSTTDKIQRANLDGTNVEDIITLQAGSNLKHIALDTSAGKIYWVDSGTEKIQRANLDGTSLEELVSIAGSSLQGIALDPAAGRMYWTDSLFDKIQRSNVPDKPIYDNAFVTHEIPQADLRYAWIAASALTTESQLPGHQQSSSVPYGPYDDIDYVLSSSEGRGDFLGISGSTLNKANISIETPLGSTNFLSKSSGVIFNVYNGPYQHSSWNQVRNSYNPVVKKLVENSILSLANRQKTITNSNGNQVNSIRSDGVTNYKEPVVSSNSRPIEHSLAVRPDLTSLQTVSSSLKYTYTNNLSTFTRVSIKEKANIKESSDPTLYGDIKEYYLDEAPGGDNPVDSFVDLNYSQILYPSVVNAYINTTRYRTEYSEVAGTGSNGYDRIFGTQRTFYKDDQIRNRDAPNSQGYVFSDVATDIASLYDFGQEFSLTFLIDSFSAVRLDDNLGVNAFCFGTSGSLSNPSAPDPRYIQWKDTFQTSSVSSDITISFEVTKGTYGTFDGTVTLDPPEAGEDLLLQYRSEATGTTWQTVQTITPSELTAGVYSLTGTSFVPGEPVSIRIAQINKDTVYYNDNYAIKNLQITASFADVNKLSLNFNSMATDGIRSFPESSSYREYNGELMQDSDGTMFSSIPAPSLSYHELYNIRVNQTSSGYVERLTEEITNKNSWYNTYEDFANDVRPHTKNKSIIPEFKMSEHIPYYIVEKGNDFRAPNKKMLSLDGASVTSSANSEEDELFDDDFVTKYVYSSDSSKFADMTEEHEEVAAVSRASFSCKGIKKLLPYNGFYPKERTVQLGNLLSQSLGDNVDGTYEGSAGSYPNQGWQGVLKPLMSPGILYNSIKSGLAVDYPIYTGSVPGLVLGNNTPSDFKLSVGPNYRLPFEALVDLKGNLPEGDDNPIRLVSSFVTDENDFNTEQLFNYKSVWNGQKTDLFELGMHNFLAETVDFFLQDGGLKNFRSAPENEWNRFREGTSYYMDVVLRDTVEMNKFIEYSGSGDVSAELVITSSAESPLSGNFGDSVSSVLIGDSLYTLVGSTTATSSLSPVRADGAAYLYVTELDELGLVENSTIASGSRQLAVITGSNLFNDDLGVGFGQSVKILSGSDGLYTFVGAANQSSSAGVISSRALSGSIYIHKYDINTNNVTEVGQIEPQATAKAPPVYGAENGLGYDIDVVYSELTGFHLISLARSSELWSYYTASTAAGLTSGRSFVINEDDFETAYENLPGVSPGDWGSLLINRGDGVSISSGSNAIHMLLAASNSETRGGTLDDETGAALLVAYSSSVSSSPSHNFITSSDWSDLHFFGRSVGVVSDPSTDRCEFVISSGGGQDFYSFTSSSTGIVEEGKFDGFTIGLRKNAILSSSSGLVFSPEYWTTAVPPSTAGAIYLSNSSGVVSQSLSPLGGKNNSGFGRSCSILSSSTELLLTVGSDTYSADAYLSGTTAGASYLFTGTVGGMTDLLTVQDVQQDYKQHGKLYGLALEDA
jgi:sugar lactone lactonase YvrE